MKRTFFRVVAALAVLALAVGAAYGYSPIDMSAQLTCNIDWYEGFTAHADGLGVVLANGALAGGTAEAVKEATEKIRAELDTATLEMRNSLKANLQEQLAVLDARIQKGENAGQGVAELKEKSDKMSQDNAKWVDGIQALVKKHADELNLRIDEIEGARKSKGGLQIADFGSGLAKAVQDAKMGPYDEKMRATYKVEGMMPHVFHRKDISVTGSTVYEPLYSPGIIGPGQRQLRVRDLLPRNRTSKNQVFFVLETALTDNAGPQTSLGATKGETTFNVTVSSATVQTLAHFIQVPLQLLDDITGLQDYINGRMMFLLDQEEEDQLLYGNNIGSNLNGLMTQATAFDTTLLTELSVDTPTDIDRLRAAIAQVNVADYPADGIVMHTYNWAGIEMLKDSQKRYIFAMPQDRTVPRMWGLPVVPTTAMQSPDFLVGAFALAAAIWDLQQSQIAISTEDGDNFKKNMATVRAEERVALTVYRPASLVEGDFADTIT